MVLAQVHIEEYGCSASQADSEMIAGMLASKGHTITQNQANADVSVIVTCSVKDATAKRMMNRMRHLSAKPLVVAGCMAKAEPQTVAKFAPQASIVGPGAISRINELVDAALDGNKIVVLDGTDNKVNLPRMRLNSAVGIVEIASGCMSECSFCQTKLAKGGLQSYRIGDIVRQIRTDVADGCLEIWLTSTDNGCYGFDIGSSLPELLHAISDIKGDFRIRVGMMNPMYMGRILDGLEKEFSRESRIYRFLHIPVQSGSDKILHDMKRSHTAQTFIDAAKKLRNKFSQFCIATDIIVGFPTESDEDFKQTVQLLKETKPDIINLSKYSSRPGTDAAQLARLNEQETKHRSRIIHDLSNEISLENNKRWLGWQGRITLTEESKYGLTGRNYAYRKITLTESEGQSLGDTVNAKIIKINAKSLIAKIS